MALKARGCIAVSFLLPVLGCGDASAPADTPGGIGGSGSVSATTANAGAVGATGGAAAGGGSAGMAGQPGGSAGGPRGDTDAALGADARAGADAAFDGTNGREGDAGDGGYVGLDRIVCNPGTGGNGIENVAQTGLQTDPPEWQLGAGVKAGTLTASASFLSKIYGQHFPYRIYASANVVKGQPAVFMTYGDGGTYISGFHTPTVLDNLTAAGDVPPTVALFIDPPSDGDRVQTYDPPTDKYSRFLLEEIVPAVIEPVYTISKDPAAWATGGYSASGEQGWTVLWTTDKFHKFFGHDASFGAAPTYGVDWAKTIAAAPARDLRVSLVVADVGKDLVDQRGDWTLINEGVANALASKGDAYRLIIGPGDHGGPASQRDFPAALRWGFRGCKF